MPITIPIMLPIVILIFSAKVSTKTPRSKVSGCVNPKFFPKFIQERKDMLAVACAIKLPKTIPANNNKKSAQLFFPAPFAI